MYKTSNKFQLYLKKSVNDIENELKRIAKDLDSTLETNFPEIRRLNKRFSDSLFGGKMLRGTFVKLGYELINAKQADTILKPSAAFEILHTALLIHDDIIDQSPKRRGKPAFHIHKNSHYGISQAICFGDIGIFLAGKLISESEFPENKKNKALTFFYEMIIDTVIGEMMDVASTKKALRTEQKILQIHKMKTAHYSFVGPLILGAILAGAKDEYLLKLKQFSEPLGVAYQIQDDILGIFGDEKIVGKSIVSDIEENKNTLLISYALKQANKQQLKLLKNFYGKKGLTKNQQETIKEIFVDTGALSYSQNKIKLLTSEVILVIAKITKNKKKQKLLKDLCDFLLTRNA